MSDVAVQDWSMPSADQMKEFWEKVSRREIGLKNLQCFLDNPMKFIDSNNPGLVSLTQAKKCLGRGKVVTVANFNKVWESQFENFPIFYDYDSLFRAGQQNKMEGQDWRLIFYAGYSIWDIKKMQDYHQKGVPHFLKTLSWRLKREGSNLFDTDCMTGYYLINFNGQFGGLDYDSQEICIKEFEKLEKSGGSFQRTDANIFTEAALTIFKLTRERIAENWQHVPAGDYLGSFLSLGMFKANGFSVYLCKPSPSTKDLRVSLCRQWQSAD